MTFEELKKAVEVPWGPSNASKLKQEITARLLRSGVRIYEVPISYSARSRETSARRRATRMLFAFCKATDRSNSSSLSFAVTDCLQELSPRVSCPARAPGSWQKQCHG